MHVALEPVAATWEGLVPEDMEVTHKRASQGSSLGFVNAAMWEGLVPEGLEVTALSRATAACLTQSIWPTICSPAPISHKLICRWGVHLGNQARQGQNRERAAAQKGRGGRHFWTYLPQPGRIGVLGNNRARFEQLERLFWTC